jgi:hypothetical protein
MPCLHGLPSNGLRDHALDLTIKPKCGANCQFRFRTEVWRDYILNRGPYFRPLYAGARLFLGLLCEGLIEEYKSPPRYLL